MLKRWIFRMIARETWTQLVAWVFLCLLVSSVIWFVGSHMNFKWQEVIGIFLDPGVFGGAPMADHPVFRLLVALLSIFFISSLLVSIITNMFNNITEAVRNGDVHYGLKDFILIIGSGDQARRIIRNQSGSHRIVVFSPQKPDLPEEDFIFYRGARDNEERLRSIEPDKASVIYIIGEENEIDHDSRNLACLDIVKKIVESSKTEKSVKCFMTLQDYTTSEIYMYSQKRKQESGKFLMVDVINENDLYSEVFFTSTDFLPVLDSNSKRSAHFVILGAGDISRAMAFTIAHMCHYPDIAGRMRKTTISIMDKDAWKMLSMLKASRPELFRLSEYSSIGHGGFREDHTPKAPFLDVKWEFIAMDPLEDDARTMLEALAADQDKECRLIVCQEDDRENVTTAIHLPQSCRKIPVALYLSGSNTVARKADETNMYGDLSFFGPGSLRDEEGILERRSQMGQRVNHVYSNGLTCDPKEAIEANWYSQPEANKYSSIYSANAMHLREKCFNMAGERRCIYEAEHRRWNESELIMGFVYDPEAVSGSKKRKERFLHNDIVPFEDLPAEEQDKDKRIIDAMEYILTGKVMTDFDNETLSHRQ